MHPSWARFSILPSKCPCAVPFLPSVESATPNQACATLCAGIPTGQSSDARTILHPTLVGTWVLSLGVAWLAPQNLSLELFLGPSRADCRWWALKFSSKYSWTATKKSLMRLRFSWFLFCTGLWEKSGLLILRDTFMDRDACFPLRRCGNSVNPHQWSSLASTLLPFHT